MKHRLTLVIMIGFSVLSLVGTILVSASNHATTKPASPSTRPEVPRPSERHETFCVSPAPRKPGKATIELTQPEAERPGQTATALPDGRLLLVGGAGADGAVATAEIRDTNSGVSVTVAGLQRARAWHSATMLPNGDVLITGGVEAKDHLVEAAEIFNATEERFETISITGLTPRAHHAATLL